MNMIEKRKAMAGQGGFTLIELLVVIAILAVLSGAAVIGIGAMRSNAKKQVCKTNQETVETAAEAMALDDATSNVDTFTVGAMQSAGYIKTGFNGASVTGATRTSPNAAFKADGTC